MKSGGNLQARRTSSNLGVHLLGYLLERQAFFNVSSVPPRTHISKVSFLVSIVGKYGFYEDTPVCAFTLKSMLKAVGFHIV
jgi:hypothetical protein